MTTLYRALSSLAILSACAAQPALGPSKSPIATNSDGSQVATVRWDNAAASEHGAEPSEEAVPYIVPVHSEHTAQSPINIESSRATTSHHALQVHYKLSKEHLENNGHTIKVAYDPGSTLEFDGKSYDLVQFHFHTPSEHLLDGVTYPMELHLVHTEHERPEHMLVIGVLFKEGEENALISQLLADVPKTAGRKLDRDTPVDASCLISPTEGYFHYEGSLTTPPYTEAVTWLVVDRAHSASAAQIETLNRLEGNNARHIQEHHARLVDHTP